MIDGQALNGRERPRCHEETRGTGHQREERALGEKLPDELAASRAEGEAHRDLPMPRGEPAQEERGDVSAGDQKHQGHGAQEEVKGRADVAY